MDSKKERESERACWKGRVHTVGELRAEVLSQHETQLLSLCARDAVILAAVRVPARSFPLLGGAAALTRLVGGLNVGHG